ncbi:S9 family peptidase [Sphingomonas sp. SUN039]|uniref:alpha/beta hydrolase family protein n=1 Tax=Sphingomonas sp. SUN039 TaxID=2937787 RepID=UPI00216448FE|nr:alpha/beta fold hydrolase [Sphingomonas sp. SUN039]UVO55257.1 alpha/beta fold hydrolase [Sphingomonas sp. SUN039]
MPTVVKAQGASSPNAISTPAAAAAGRYPIWVFGKKVAFRGPSISPDGTKLAVQFARNGKGAIGIIDLAKPGTPPTFVMSTDEVRETGDRTVDGYTWVGNDNIVITLISRETIGGQLGDVTRLIGYNLNRKNVIPLAWDGAVFSADDVLYIDHDKGTFLLQRESNAYGTEMMRNPEVVSVDVNTGKFSVVQRPNAIVGNWHADATGVIRAADAGDSSTDTSGRRRLLYRSNGKEPFRTVLNEADATFTGTQVTPSFFLPEPDSALSLNNKDEYRRIYKLDMKTMKLGDVVFERPGYDVGGIVTNWDDTKVIGYRYTDTRNRTVWIDKDWQVIQSLMDEQFGRGNAQIASRDKKDEKLVFYVAKPSQPGGYYLFDTVSGKLQLIGWRDAVFKDADLNPSTMITYTARDGTKIPALVTLPRARLGQKNLPVVVLPHGGPFGLRDRESFDTEGSWHQALAEQGYVVIKPNYRGSGGYGKTFTLKGRTPEGYGKTMQDDLNDAVAWFAKDGLIDPKRACVMGWSYGGYAAARGAQRDPDLWRCAVAGAGIYDVPMMTRWDKEHLSTFSAKFQATSNDPEGISSARHTDSKWAPILIVAGLRDQRIPIEQSRTLVSRLKASGKKDGVDFRYVEQPKGTHQLPYEELHVQWLEEALGWLERWNPAYVATDKDKPLPFIAVDMSLKPKAM